jgi:hypothetical protein
LRSKVALRLDYHPGVPKEFVTEVERAARRLGLPLDALELICQDAKVARDFLRAVRAGNGESFVEALDARALEEALTARGSGKKHASPFGVAHVL